MGLAEHVEGLLEIAVVGERAAIAGQQRLVAGIGDRRLLQHRHRLRLLSRGPQRLAVLQGRVGVLQVGAITCLGHLDIAPRISGAAGFGFVAERAGNVRRRDLAAAKPQRENRRRSATRKKSREFRWLEQFLEHLLDPHRRLSRMLTA